MHETVLSTQCVSLVKKQKSFHTKC